MKAVAVGAKIRTVSTVAESAVAHPGETGPSRLCDTEIAQPGSLPSAQYNHAAGIDL